jgi:hypothetical protein
VDIISSFREVIRISPYYLGQGGANITRVKYNTVEVTEKDLVNLVKKTWQSLRRMYLTQTTPAKAAAEKERATRN